VQSSGTASSISGAGWATATDPARRNRRRGCSRQARSHNGAGDPLAPITDPDKIIRLPLAEAAQSSSKPVRPIFCGYA
jgi:hypothetical protein